MSGSTAARIGGAGSPARVAGQPHPRKGRPPRERLFLVPPVATSAPRAPFVVLVASLLVAGLAGLLFLHTALAEDSFRLHDLQVRAAVLDDKEQALQQSIAMAASPARLSAEAKALGMVRSENPAFIRLSDGKILGKPKAGVAPPPPVTPTPTASGSAGPSASASAGTGRQTAQQGASATAQPSPRSSD